MARKIVKPEGPHICMRQAVEWLNELGIKFREPRWEDRHILLTIKYEGGYTSNLILRCNNELDYFLSSAIFGVKPRYFNSKEDLKRMIDNPWVP